jgi:N6-adenosine-specific RNA methylase IME4
VPYSTVAWDDLWHLMDAEVFSQAAEHHALFLWTLEQFLTPTEAEMGARGYRRITRLVWNKGTRGLYCGAYLRTHEYLLWYCKPCLLPIAANQRGKFPTVIDAQRREHSRKPSAAYAMVEALYPDARKLDAFTRELRPGWDGWGNERDHFTPLLAPLREGNQ